MSALADLRETLQQLELLNKRPILKSVTMHPDDFETLMRIAKTRTNERCTLDEMFGPVRFDGVPIYQSDMVRKGQPWYDPPEAGPRPRQSDAPDGEG